MHFISSAHSSLQLSGIFPWHESSKLISWALNTYRFIVFVVIAVHSVTMTVQMVVATDLTILARTIDLWTMFISGLYKWVFMTVFNKDFDELNTSLLPVQAQGIVSYGKSANSFMADYLKVSKKLTYWYLFAGVLTGVFMISGPLFTYPKGNRSEFEYYNDPKSYPLCCWIPFKVEDSRMFVTLYLCYSFALMLAIWIYLSIDTYFFGAVYAIGGQVEILNISLNNITNSFGEVHDSSTSNEMVRFDENQQLKYYLRLRECVKYHIMILERIHHVRTLFSSLIIIDYLHGLTSVTFALFQMTISKGIGEIIGIVGFILVSVSHQFLNNFCGEHIIQKQKSIILAAYHVPWWRGDKRMRQLLSLMILRSQNPIMVTGFYMYKLCYESFIVFVKALYTYYMVLRQING